MLTFSTKEPLTAKLSFAIAVLSATVGLYASAAHAQDEENTVYFLSDTSATPRWASQDEPNFVKSLKEFAPGLNVKFMSAEGDPSVQADQVNNAITLGAKAIVLVTVDENAAGGMLVAADRAKVPLILYEHNGKGGPASARVFFDFEKTGYLQGKVAADDLAKADGVQNLARIHAIHGLSITEDFARGQDRALQPLYDSGKVKLVCDDWTTGVSIAEAQRLAEQCLARNENNIDAFIGPNDAYIVGLIAAAQTAGLKPGETKMFGGQDADIAGLQNMIRGLQVATIYKPFKKQAEVAAEMVASLVVDGKLPDNLEYGSESNGAAEIPEIKLTPIAVRANEIGMLVKDGVYTWDDICVGDVASSVFCKTRK